MSDRRTRPQAFPAHLLFPFSVLAIVESTLCAHAQSIETVLDFNGISTYSALVQGPGPDGYLYGTTYSGGAHDEGTVFRVLPNGANPSVIHSFDCSQGGCYPTTELTLVNGMLYGTTSFGGANNAGTIFKIAPDATGSSFTDLVTFDCGVGCSKFGLIVGTGGYLYGTTLFGGDFGHGEVFKYFPDDTSLAGHFSFLCSGTGACLPSSRLFQSSIDGYLYGTTFGPGNGAVYRLLPDFTGFQIVHTFSGAPGPDPDGYTPQAPLIQGIDGYLYGTTTLGGAYQYGTDVGGTVYRVEPAPAPNNVFNVIHSFQFTDGRSPMAGLNQRPDGTLVGTTRLGGDFDSGTVFQLSPDGSHFSFLSLTSQVDHISHGCFPQAELLKGNDGNLYSTAPACGAFGSGTVFRVSFAKQAPKITWSDPAPIVYGTLLSATQLNASADVPGTFTYIPGAGTA